MTVLLLLIIQLEVQGMLLLLVIIYLAFISLGLPDAILGAAWPTMGSSIQAPLEFAGILSFLMSLGTVCSRLLTTHLLNRFGIGKVVAFSVLLTASALLGFSLSHQIFAFALLSIPLGIGAGAVDSALNNFVALNYRAKHMNYLHSFWGVGATAGPLIMANYLMFKDGWRQGYETIALLQFGLVFILFLSLPLWKKTLSNQVTIKAEKAVFISNKQALKKAGVSMQLVLFFCYCALELGTGLWSASYLTIEKGVEAETAAFWTAMFYLGITLGRFLCGIIADKFNEESMIRLGVISILVGALALVLPLPAIVSQLGLVLIGLGCAPIFPNTLHLTPKRFGKAASQAVIGLSIATAYVGITLVPPLMGALFTHLSFAYFPFTLLTLGIGLLLMTEQLKRLDTSANMETTYDSNNGHL